MERGDRNEHDSGVVPGRCVRFTGEAARVPIPGHNGHHEPQIALVRQGDTIQAIDITCSCGQRIRLNCVYG
ncbi:MAG TPA: hypothetical protein VFA18_04670 [Gemmataceae bacterium]|nr:hypothetical protein [Gemmataceae bacterium]